jgi:hypothetical protein
MEFAKDIFKSWDYDGDGTIDESEMTTGLV